MKKVLGVLAILVIAGLVLAGCANPAASSVDANRSAKGVGDIVWVGADDIKVAVDLPLVENVKRDNASGAKIPSNAHSNDFEGIYIKWEAKQKDPAYVKVHKSVFDGLKSFTLTSKESNTYWDFTVEVQPGQELTADDCYVFSIPKMSGKNINMFLLADYIDNAKPYYYATPMFSDGADGDYFYPNYALNPGNAWSTSNFDPALFVYNDKYGKTVGNAQYTWSSPAAEPVYGEIADFIYSYNVPGDVVTGGTDFKIAADNAFVLLVNDNIVTNSPNLAYIFKEVPGYPTTVGRLDANNNLILNAEGVSQFRAIGPGDGTTSSMASYMYYAADWDAAAWNTVYTIAWADIAQYFHTGSNKIEVIAYNTPDNSYGSSGLGLTEILPDGGWKGTVDNNPAAILFAGTVYSKDVFNK